LDEKGNPRRDIENVIPEFQDLRHVFQLPKITTSNLVLPSGRAVSKREIYFGADQMSSNNYALAKIAWQRAVLLENSVSVSFKTDNRIETTIVRIPVEMLRKMLIENRYKEARDGQINARGLFSVEGNRIRIFFQEGIYPRTIMGVRH
jgi:hypothetical protein